jgi:hypothetical protein
MFLYRYYKFFGSINAWVLFYVQMIGFTAFGCIILRKQGPKSCSDSLKYMMFIHSVYAFMHLYILLKILKKPNENLMMILYFFNFSI